VSASALTSALKAQAIALGFHKVAIARAAPLERDRAALAAWLRGDRHATMAWMAKDPDKRADPEEMLPGCRSVVALAVNYWPGDAEPVGRVGSARVARYAHGRDYHKVLGRMLKDLAGWLNTASGALSRTFVDTGPVLERAWAERAGLGWIGKNANLLTRDLGSWILLGEVLTCAELEADAGPHEEFCGTCTACLDACPTAAITSPGVVDSNACISYWTIEHRGSVPAAVRSGMGEWIFGCDVCQDVCPWNVSFAKPAADDPFGRRDDLSGLDPVEILGLDEAAFRARYSGTSLMRARFDGMRRNACIVLGNRGDAGALPALRTAAGDPDPVLREHALWAIAMIEAASAESRL
jgi:epoxyqueuosine reductase